MADTYRLLLDENLEHEVLERLAEVRRQCRLETAASGSPDDVDGR